LASFFASTAATGTFLARSGHTALAFARRHPFVATLAVTAAISSLFLIAPGIDLWVAGLFRGESGFPSDGAAQSVRELATLVGRCVLFAMLAPFVLKLVWPRARMLFSPRISLFMPATLAIGPGLVVNGILKEFWGRARPREILDFGGDLSFSPVWQPAGQCDGNCSFVSGEAASAFWLVCLVLVVPKAWRGVTALATLALALAVGWARMAAGGHFLSDVLLAWCLTLLVAIALYRPLMEGLTPAFDLAIERRLASVRPALAALARRIRGGRLDPLRPS
jgi:membrane-associated phospholipid phosphatase